MQADPYKEVVKALGRRRKATGPSVLAALPKKRPGKRRTFTEEQKAAFIAEYERLSADHEPLNPFYRKYGLSSALVRSWITGNRRKEGPVKVRHPAVSSSIPDNVPVGTMLTKLVEDNRRMREGVESIGKVLIEALTELHNKVPQ